MSLRTPSRLLLGLAALIMLAGGAFHGLAYPKALAMIDASSLSARAAAIYKGLWLNDAAVVMLVGLVCLVLASKPALATRPMVGLLSALPLAGALSIYSTVGNFLPGHLLLAAALMMAVAALVPESHEGRWGAATGRSGPTGTCGPNHLDRVAEAQCFVVRVIVQRLVARSSRPATRQRAPIHHSSPELTGCVNLSAESIGYASSSNVFPDPVNGV